MEIIDPKNTKERMDERLAMMRKLYPDARPTNADRIRAMSDEELEAEFWRIYMELPNYSSSSAWLHEWLKQESEGK